MSTYTTYADLNNVGGTASDTRTWDECQDPETPALTLAKIVVLAKTGANTSPGDTIIVNVRSSEVRTSQCIEPDWDATGLTFTFQPYLCTGNTGGKWFCKGPDATKIALVQTSAITGAGALFVCNFTDMSFLEGASTTKIIHIGDTTDDPLYWNFNNCTIEAPSCQLISGTGGSITSQSISLLNGTIVTLAAQAFSSASKVTSVTIDDSSVTQTAGSFMEFSADQKLTYLSITDSTLSTGDLTTHHGIDCTNNNASLIRIKNCKISASQGTAANIIYVPDSGTANCLLDTSDNKVYFTGAGSTGAPIYLGSPLTNDTRANIVAAMNARWINPKCNNNVTCQTKADGPSLIVHPGITGCKVKDNLIKGVAGGSGHTFQVSADETEVMDNFSIGNLPYMHFGNNITCKGNTFIQVGTSAACLMGVPAGTSWEPGEGGEISGNNIIQLAGTNYAISDYSNGGLGVWDITTVVKNNRYFMYNGGSPILLRNTACDTIEEAKTQWSAMATPLPNNDDGSIITNNLSPHLKSLAGILGGI